MGNYYVSRHWITNYSISDDTHFAAVEGNATGNLRIRIISDDGNIEGIQFTLTKASDSSFKRTGTTDKDGYLDIYDLEPDTYTVEEKYNDLYAGSVMKKNIKVSAGVTNIIIFSNKSVKGRISVQKVSEDGNVAGISFGLIRYKGADTQSDVYMYEDKVTDESGYVEWDNLPDKDPKTGEKYYYEIGENNVPDQFRKPVTLYIGEFQEGKEDDGNAEAIDLTLFGDGEHHDVTVTCYNRLKRSEVKIIKRDEETGEVIPLEGAQFQVYKAENGAIVGEPLTLDGAATFTTDASGSVVLPETLTYGQYAFVEVIAPEGYVLDEEPVFFSVTQDISESNYKMVEVQKYDKDQKGLISISKVGDIFQSVNQNADGTYSAVFEEGFLEGAEFDVIANQDFLTPQGEVRVENGTVVDHITTDSSGSASSKELYLGCYKLVETKAPTGYILDSSEILVDLTYAGQEVEVTSSGATASNRYQNVEITVPKTMESATEYGIDASDYVRYVTFGLYANEDITAADGSAIPQDGLIQTVELSDNMTANFNAKLPFGSYYVKELTTDEHSIRGIAPSFNERLRAFAP